MRQIRKRQGKRIAGAVLALLLMLSCVMIPDTQAKAQNMIIALSSKSVKIGDTLTVTVTLPAGVTGTVNLTYSKDVFTYKSASAEASVNAGTVVMTLGSYGANNARATGTVTFQADAAGSASFAASAPSAGNQEGDRVSVGGASVAVNVENAAAESDQKSSDASLAELTISEGTLSPAFQASVTEYTAEVDNSVASIAVSAKPKDDSASVVSVSGADALKEGKNSIQIVVQAQNGVKQTYTITVTRKAAQKTEEPQTQTTTEETKETQTDTQEQMYFTLDSAKLYPADTIPDRYVPQGFSKETVTLWGKDYPCLVRNGADTPIRILYLTDADGQNGALYLLDMDVPEEIYPFVCMNYAQYKHTLNSSTAADQPSTQESGELFGDTKSQMNLILSAFVVVVLILVIIIIVLIVKKKGGDDDDDDYYDYDDEEDEDEEEDELDVPDILYKNSSSGPSKRYEEGTFRKKGGFLNKLLEGIDEEDDDEYEDDDFSGDEPEESVRNAPSTPSAPQKEPEVPLEEEDNLLQEELAKEVKSSLLGRKKPVDRSKEEDDIEFIDL